MAADTFEYARRRPVTAERMSSKAQRDIRLDVFRGLAMAIILISHTPGNSWAAWIPARFGFSDATEMFVFCSGMASAIAFGSIFNRAPWPLATARVAVRIWQVYWVHIGLFIFLVAALSAVDMTGAFEKSYIDQLNLRPFLDDPAPRIVGLLTLTYVPNYFDILPMYLVVLVMLPLFVALARIRVELALLASVLIWLIAQTGALALPAEPVGDREWFFNPFGWQLLFFTGFAFMAGWLPAPPLSRTLVWLAIAFLVLTMPLSSGHAVGFLKVVWPSAAEWAMTVYPDMEWMRSKTEQGFLRYIHFLCLAYLAFVACGPNGARLRGAGNTLFGLALKALTKMGQQTLPVFVASMALSRFMGIAIDVLPDGQAAIALVNITGLALLLLIAYVTGWFKRQPWRQDRPG
ncbi:MAG: OpgC domain-containing protein [Dinoroseobacter sp.]|nr:OpgC domain-containing protein [Dinoroseobacter sp.]